MDIHTKGSAVLELPAPPQAPTTSLRLTWVHGLRGLATIIIILGHFRLCFWEWTTYDSTDGKTYFMQMPVIRLVWAGKPAVRLLMCLSGIVLSNRTLSCVQSGATDKALKALLRGIQMRYVRLAIPLTMISVISVTLLWVGAYRVSTNSVPGYLNHGPPKSQGSLFYDIWLAVWGGFVDLYVLGYQPAHSSLWCMKAQLLGSFMLYGILLIYGGRQQYPYLMWVVAGAVLFSGQAAAARLTDAASVLFGAIVAYHMRFINPHKPVNVPGNLTLIIGGLLLCSYPTFGPTTAWAHLMLNVGRVIMQYSSWGVPVELSHQKGVAAMWHTLGACAIVYAVARLPARDAIFSHWVLQWAGTHSFALFVIHPLVFWSAGAWAFHISRQFFYSLDIEEYADAMAHFAFLMVSMPVVVFLCRAWYQWVDVRMFKWLQKIIPDPGELWFPERSHSLSQPTAPSTPPTPMSKHAHAHAHVHAVEKV